MNSKKNIIIDNLITQARKSQLILNNYSQKQVDELIVAVAWEILKPSNNEYLSKLAVATTGLGKVEDKIQKNKHKTIGLLRDLKNAVSVGVISKNIKKGIIEIARPVGVVAAIVPSTNPIATPLNKVINALKCRNAIILAPSPKGALVCFKVVSLIQKALRRMGAPIYSVQTLTMPISKVDTNELVHRVDLVVATGSQNNIKMALQSGTATFGVGVGNVPVIIDESADLIDAAKKIKASKTFDNATSCSSENSVIIVSSVYKKTIQALKDEGGILLNTKEKQILGKHLWDSNLVINRNLIAKAASDILQLVAIDNKTNSNAKFLMVTENQIGDKYPFSREKLSPILTVYKANDFTHAITLASNILQYQGRGHSCSVHSNNQANIMRLGNELPVCRIIVNQAHCFAAGGNFDNGLPFSLSMGCGTWGRNTTYDNINYKHYLNISKIVTTIKTNKPQLDSIFGSYWQHYYKNSTITEFIDNYADTMPNKVFFIDADLDIYISYSQLKIDIELLGQFFACHNIKLKDKVGFLLDNGYITTLLFLGAIYHGVTILPVNVVAGNKQIEHVIRHSECKMLFVSKAYQDKFAFILKNLTINIVDYDRVEDLTFTNTTVRKTTSKVTEHTNAILIYTSGTTGPPKGVMLSHKNIIAGGKNTVLAHKITKDDIAFCVLPLYHINAEIVSVISTIISNSSVAMTRKFKVSNFWQILAKYKCSWFSVVPTTINYLLNDNFNISELDLSRVRFGRSASAPLSPEVHKKFEKVFEINIVETMGLTETAAQILSNPLNRGKYGSAGQAFGNKVRIIDDSGNFISGSEIGELVIKGSNVMKEYYNNKTATKASFIKGNYLLTGDLGFKDKDNFFFITGRKKELIIKGGENIAPREIDDVLYTHNAVLEACAFAMADPNYGENICACVYLKTDATVSEAELQALCEAHLGKYKTPKHIILSAHPLLKGPSGKIQRLKIAANYNK